MDFYSHKLETMRISNLQTALVLLLGVIMGYLLKCTMKNEGFKDASSDSPACSNCGGNYPCEKCASSHPICPQCQPLPDITKYILKSSIPPCQTCPDMSMYMLKTECPPSPDLSHYVLKSSIPKPEPIIIDNSSCTKNSGTCPPCPRPRCPEVKCPAPVSCPAAAPCPRQKCPEKVVKCKAEEMDNNPVRPYLTPLSVTGFGGA
jgi:hypothetical protein